MIYDAFPIPLTNFIRVKKTFPLSYFLLAGKEEARWFLPSPSISPFGRESAIDTVRH